MIPHEQRIGMVIRTDGTVPFDADCHPEVKAAIIATLTAQGHTLTHHPEGHLTIHNWSDPHVKSRTTG